MTWGIVAAIAVGLVLGIVIGVVGLLLAFGLQMSRR